MRRGGGKDNRARKDDREKEEGQRDSSSYASNVCGGGGGGGGGGGDRLPLNCLFVEGEKKREGEKISGDRSLLNHKKKKGQEERGNARRSNQTT